MKRKRSEVIDDIACILVANAPYHTDLDVPKFIEIAEIILDDMVKRIGMLPPTIEFKMGDKTVKDNMWEPEADDLDTTIPMPTIWGDSEGKDD
jgi:hypothetical protein